PDRARHVAVDIRDVRQPVLREVGEGAAPRVEQAAEVGDDAPLAVRLHGHALDAPPVAEVAPQHVVEAGFHGHRADMPKAARPTPLRTGPEAAFGPAWPG